MIASSTGSHPDVRLSFLLRASAKLYLVEAGTETLDDAIADLLDAAHMLGGCCCDRAFWCACARADLKLREERFANWRTRR